MTFSRKSLVIIQCAFVVFAAARADAAKVETQRRDVRSLESARGAEHDRAEHRRRLTPDVR